MRRPKPQDGRGLTGSEGAIPNAHVSQRVRKGRSIQTPRKHHHAPSVAGRLRVATHHHKPRVSTVGLAHPRHPSLSHPRHPSLSHPRHPSLAHPRHIVDRLDHRSDTPRGAVIVDRLDRGSDTPWGGGAVAHCLSLPKKNSGPIGGCAYLIVHRTPIQSPVLPSISACINASAVSSPLASSGSSTPSA